ncbi:ATPase [Planctomycetales bacterium]|nr:ATPase [Planctomycetales bacterium]GHT06066.1 ATPase [Planctomycetales bacterium]
MMENPTLTRQIYLDKILPFVDKPLVKVFTGIRRCGKSMLLKLLEIELRRRGVKDRQILSLNFESMKYDEIKDYTDLYALVKTAVKTARGRLYILLDELQDISGWEKAVNSFLIDFDCDVYVTGSNANLLASEFATHIAGRYVEIRIYPLTFAEFLDFAAHHPDERDFSRDRHWQNYLRFGGMPGIHALNWDETQIDQYLTDIFNSVLLKDVIQRHGIREPEQLERLLRFVFDNLGNTFSAKTIADYAKNQGRAISNDTVHNFLRALEGAYVIQKAARFDVKGKRLLATQEKYFIADLGIRHALLGYRDNDIAGLLENIVFTQLCVDGYTVRIGKIGAAEIDFIAEKREERRYLQVCYLLTAGVMEREFSPLEAIPDNYEKIVLSLDATPEFNRNGVIRRSLIDFLLKK